MSRPILYAIGVFLIAVLAFLGLHQVGFRFDPFNSAGKAKTAAVTATQGQAVAQAQVPVVEGFHETRANIKTQAERSAADVQRLPTAETPLDPGFRDGLKRLLDPPAIAAGPDDPGQL